MIPNTTDMKKCPFCGSTQLSIEWIIPVWGSAVPEETISCNNCAAAAPHYIWNNRCAVNSKNSMKC